MVKSAQVYNYDTLRVPLIGNPTNRSTTASKDQVFYNGVIDIIRNPGDQRTEKDGKAEKTYFNKRGAFVASSTVDAGGGVGRGLYYWERSAKTYSVIDDTLYSNTTNIKTLTTSTGKVWFCEATGSNDYLIVCDGTKTYYVSTSDVVTEITDADFPAGAITPVSLDGYLFVLKSGTDELYNSDVNDPVSWTTGDFISAEMYPDNVLALTRQANYVVALGSFSVEFFYDNANATGSPLLRSESVAAKVGLAARDSIAQTDKRMFFIAQSQIGSPSVWMIDGLTPSRISHEFIDKTLAAEGSALANATAWLGMHKGHQLYIINLASRSLVYDLDEKVWMEWSINSGGSHAVLPFKYMTQGANQTILVLHNTDGKIYQLDATATQDDAGAILCQVVTSKIDLGHARQKRMFRFELIGDWQAAGTATVEWTDNDYQTWSTARTLDLTQRAYTKGCGVFRRRAFRITHTYNGPLRLEAMEFDISDGVH